VNDEQFIAYGGNIAQCTNTQYDCTETMSATYATFGLDMDGDYEKVETKKCHADGNAHE
jgi:hypothetical protein